MRRPWLRETGEELKKLRPDDWLIPIAVAHPELNQMALALLHHRQGDTEKARELLQQAQTWLADREANRQGEYCQTQVTGWLEAKMLLREAEAVIGSEP